MVKITNPNIGGGRPPGIKGVLIISHDPKCGFIGRSWPRFKKRKNSVNEQFAKDQFAEAQRYVAQTVSQEYQALSDLAGPTAYTWRDLRIMCIYGKLLEFTDQAGNLYRSFRLVSEAIQQDLDSITATVGSILLRTTNGWVGIPGGTPTQVLTMNEDTSLPAWNDAPSGGGGGTTVAIADLLAWSPQGVNGDPYASVGHYQTFQNDCVIDLVQGMFTTTSGRTYTVSVAPFNPATKQITATATIVQTYTETTNTPYKLLGGKLATPIVAPAGSSWAFWVSRTDATDTTNADTYYTLITPPPTTSFVPNIATGLKIAKRAPATTDTWTTQGAYWSAHVAFHQA